MHYIYSVHIHNVIQCVQKGCDAMGAKYTDAQKKASIKYIQEKTDDIRIRTSKGTKDRWKKTADKLGMSMTQFVVGIVEEDKAIFKGYQRGLLRSLKAMEEAANARDYEQVKKMLAELIEDTEKNIEE